MTDAPPGIDPEVWAALAPASHRHAFAWASGTTHDSEPPDSATCACGLSYGEYLAARP